MPNEDETHKQIEEDAAEDLALDEKSADAVRGGTTYVTDGKSGAQANTGWDVKASAKV